MLVGLPILLCASAAFAAPDLERTTQPERSPRFGVMTDVGLPDGATASLLYRPIRALRLHAGLAHNLVSTGVRGGITWVPFGTWATPTLSVDYGHYPDGNANPIAQRVSGDKTFSSPLLDRVGYDYANAQIGLELGRKWFTFYLHAGASRITTSVHNLNSTTTTAMSTTTTTFASDPAVKVWTVSASLGFIVYLAK